ncbi:MAG: zinc-finger domain-containing protein [Paracoccaceae bacterium]|nr:zinc-finger domain-containing protein [Paracoccaceae bacterium]
MATEVPEVKAVTETRVACDGGAGGHPRVWLRIPNEQGWIECPYCDCRFVLSDESDGPE